MTSQQKKNNAKGKKVSHIDHVLMRPDMYIKSIKTFTGSAYVFDYENGGIIFKDNLTCNYGLYNIIREIGSNCVDNKWRSEKAGIPMKSIKISWSSETKTLTFWNDGAFMSAEQDEYTIEDYKKGITVTETLFPAEMNFGDFFSGTNLDDTEERKTSGRNGTGAKATNAFSVMFRVEHTDTDAGKKFVQIYKDNSKKRDEPKITSFKGKTAYTEISFIPDFGRFNFDITKEKVFEDFKGRLGYYAVEMAAVTSLPVHFQVDDIKKTFHLKTFDKFVRMFYSSVKDHKMASITLDNGDECVIVESHVDSSLDIPLSLETARDISFVNGSRTSDGGTHVEKWRDVIFPTFVRAFNSRPAVGKKVSLKTTAKEVYPYITLFIKAEMDKPSFDEQYKDCLNSTYNVYPIGKSKEEKAEHARIKETIDEIVKKMLKWNFVPLLEAKLSGGTVKATKKIGRIDLGNKLTEANFAVKGKYPERCIFTISEGMSAKALVIRGNSLVEDGHNTNGVLALQGKFINVYDLTKEQVEANKEANAIMAAINMKIGVKYDNPENFKTLRYHHIRIMTDMDDDGIHIRSLVINFLYKYWPELFDMKVVTSLSTGLVKVSFKKNLSPKIFYSLKDYKEWYENADTSLIKGNPEYSKGLAAIDKKDTPLYFLDQKIVTYVTEENVKEFMALAFDKKIETVKETSSADKRKKWLIKDMKAEFDNNLSSQKEEKIEISVDDLASITETEITNIQKNNTKDLIEKCDYVFEGTLGLSSFINNQVSIYHKMTFERALPLDMDGLKRCQRQILYAIRKKNYKSATDFERVSGAIKDITGYHHGAASLLGTMRNMVAKYPGSNNIALLLDHGETGTRCFGPDGTDAGAERYIKTMEEQITKFIFLEEDEPLLEHRIEENHKVEYLFYLPIFPYNLVNGSEGIATGFKNNNPNYNPLDIINWITKWLSNEHYNLPKLIPWYRGINGPITLEEKVSKKGEKKKCWRTTGILTECGSDCDVYFHHIDKKTMKHVKKKCQGENGWWHVIDLPVGYWTEKFTQELTYLETGNPPEGSKRKKLEKKCIKEYRQYNTANRVHFMIKPMKDWVPSIESTLKMLSTTKSLNNMVCIDSNSYPKRYDSPEDILLNWCPKRLMWYAKRLEYYINLNKTLLNKTQNKLQFIKFVIDKKINVNQLKSNVIKNIEEMGLCKFFKDKDKSNDDQDDDNKKESQSGYEYLLNMKIFTMTTEKIKELEKDIENIMIKIEYLSSKKPSELWLEDFEKFKTEYKKYLNLHPLK